MASDEWKKALDLFLPLLQRKLEPRNLKPELYEEAGGFLTEEEVIRVFDVDSDSRIERVEKLIKILKEKTSRAFKAFCSILDRNNCSEMAASLRKKAGDETESSLGAVSNPIPLSLSNNPFQETAHLSASLEQTSLLQAAPKSDLPQSIKSTNRRLGSIGAVQTEHYLPSQLIGVDHESLSDSFFSLQVDSGLGTDFSLQSNRSRLHLLQSSTPQSTTLSFVHSEATVSVADVPPNAAETNLCSRDKELSDEIKSLFQENLDLSGTVHEREPALDEFTPEGLPGMITAPETSQNYAAGRISHSMSKSYPRNLKTKGKTRSYSNDEKEKEHLRRNTEPAKFYSNIIKNQSLTSIRSIRKSISVPEGGSFSSSKPSPSPFTMDQMLLLTVPDLLAEHDKDWYDFGLMLDINPGSLNKIKNRYNNADHRCVVMLESLMKDEEMSAFSVLEKNLSGFPEEWSQKFWSATRKKAAELATFSPQLGAAICRQVNETLLAGGRPDERLIQALSNSDAVASHYWQIARLLGLSIDAMEHIEESVTEGQLKKKVLEVFRKWMEIQGGSTLCLFQVLHHLKIDLQPFVGHMNAINRRDSETDSAASINDQFSDLPITTAVLTATQSEYDTVLGYFGVEQNEPPINCEVYLCNNDPSLEGNPPELHTLDVNEFNLKHVERLLLVSFPAVRKAFVVYQPKSSKARQATSEMLHLADNYNWPLKYFYIIGFCSYYAKDPQGALGQIMLVECLDDYNQGDLTDGQFTFVSNQHKMSPELFQTVFHWADNGPNPEWNVPFEHVKRVCSAPRRVRCEEVASKLLANDSSIAIETEGIGMLTVKEVVDEARSHLEYIVVKGAAHHADVPSEQPQLIRLFDQNPRECGALEREAIATLHSIVLVTRCIVLDMPRITGV